MPGKKLSSAQRRSRARKAAITRCQNACVKSGGKKKRSMSSGARKAASSRARKNLGPWLAHVAAVRAGMSEATKKRLGPQGVLKKASESYRK